MNSTSICIDPEAGEITRGEIEVSNKFPTYIAELKEPANALACQLATQIEIAKGGVLEGIEIVIDDDPEEPAHERCIQLKDELIKALAKVPLNERKIEGLDDFFIKNPEALGTRIYRDLIKFSFPQYTKKRLLELRQEADRLLSKNYDKFIEELALS